MVLGVVSLVWMGISVLTRAGVGVTWGEHVYTFQIVRVLGHLVAFLIVLVAT
jgi:hypothetical protein